MPFNTQLMLTYTQKSFWDIYEKSSPFGDNNYNPGLVLGKPVIRNSKLHGIVSLAAEHESNGKDGLDSRSWNYLTLSGVYFYNAFFTVQAKLWYGALGDENPDLFNYKGYGLLALNYRSFNGRWGASLVVNPCKAAVNTTLELTFKPNRNANQYLFLQWHQGYGGSLLEYNRYASMLRFGICIRPPMRNFY
jgi:phospholipase A1